MANLAEANIYFDTYVAHNQPWTMADDEKKQRSLNQAESMLYLEYAAQYDIDTQPLPDRAIYEQALWILRQDDVIMAQDFNVIGRGVGPVWTQMKGTQYSKISPEVKKIIEEDLRARSDESWNGKFGWVVM